MSNQVIKVHKLNSAAEIPAYESNGASGMDLRSVVTTTIWPGERKLIPTGLAFDIPTNHEIQIRPRSGLAYKQGITVLNTPGTIDEDYTGELKVLLINHGDKDFRIKTGDRIAQMVLAEVSKVEMFLQVDSDHYEEHIKNKSSRGAGSFGSTGIK